MMSGPFMGPEKKGFARTGFMGKKDLITKLMVCILCLNIAACTKEENIFQIEDTDISAEQFGYYISKNRSEVISEYQEDGEAIDEAFWEKETQEGLTVAGQLKEKARQQCLYDQMLLIVAEKKGAADSSSFEDLQEKMENENQERKKKIEGGQVVYGNRSYSMETYMSYYFSNLTAELLKKMENQELKFTDEELREYCASRNRDIYNMEQGQTIRSMYGMEYRTYLLEEYIRQRVEESDVTVNQKAYNSVEIQ